MEPPCYLGRRFIGGAGQIGQHVPVVDVGSNLSARARATVDFPAPGGPVTTTRKPMEGLSLRSSAGTADTEPGPVPAGGGAASGDEPVASFWPHDTEQD